MISSLIWQFMSYWDWFCNHTTWNKLLCDRWQMKVRGRLMRKSYRNSFAHIHMFMHCTSWKHRPPYTVSCKTAHQGNGSFCPSSFCSSRLLAHCTQLFTNTLAHILHPFTVTRLNRGWKTLVLGRRSGFTQIQYCSILPLATFHIAEFGEQRCRWDWLKVQDIYFTIACKHTTSPLLL